MSYLAYHFTVHPPQPGSEILMAMIADLGFDTFDFSDQGFVGYIHEEQAGILDFSALQFEDFTYTYTVESIPAANWNAEWEKNFEPVQVDDLLLIRAPFHEEDPSVKYEVVIMPKMSFGTGHHQTTRLMCKTLLELDLKDKRLLDMGCGTGVLAILACKLGARDMLGVDIDEWSVENSRENCIVNGCTEIIIKKGDASLLAGEAPFEIILANINKNILKADMPVYSDRLKKGGQLLLSGFFTTDVDELRKVAESQHLKFLATHHENEWAMIVLEKE